MTDRTHPAAIDVGGTPYLRDAKGNLVPLAAVKPVDLLMDELVRLQLAQAHAVSTAIAGFKTQAFEAMTGFQGLLAQDYGTTLGGQKGNITLLSYDGCQKVQVAVADVIEFGPELQAAKVLIDECLGEWAADSRVELKSLVNRVFAVDKEGQINRAELFMLLRVEIGDERWKRAMDAIRDSIRVVGARTYMRFYERAGPDAAWQAVKLDMASA